MSSAGKKKVIQIVKGQEVKNDTQATSPTAKHRNKKAIEYVLWAQHVNRILQGHIPSRDLIGGGIGE